MKDSILSFLKGEGPNPFNDLMGGFVDGIGTKEMGYYCRGHDTPKLKNYDPKHAAQYTLPLSSQCLLTCHHPLNQV